MNIPDNATPHLGTRTPERVNFPNFYNFLTTNYQLPATMNFQIRVNSDLVTNSPS